MTDSCKVACGVMFIRDGKLVNIYKLRCDVLPRIHIKRLKEVKNR